MTAMQEAFMRLPGTVLDTKLGRKVFRVLKDRLHWQEQRKQQRNAQRAAGKR